MSATAFCTVEASTKRNVSLGSGRMGAPTAHLVGLMVTPLWPVGRETVNLLELNSPREYKEVFAVPSGDTLADVKEGDLLVHSGAEYPIFWVGEWNDLAGGIPCLHIVVSQVKST